MQFALPVVFCLAFKLKIFVKKINVVVEVLKQDKSVAVGVIKLFYL